MNIKGKLTTLIPFVLDEEAAAKGQKSLGVELEENETEVKANGDDCMLEENGCKVEQNGDDDDGWVARAKMTLMHDARA